MTVKPKPQHFRRLSTPKGYPYPDLSRFLDGYEVVSPVADIPAGSGGRIYWLDWERNFDYVLGLHCDVAGYETRNAAATSGRRRHRFLRPDLPRQKLRRLHLGLYNRYRSGLIAMR
jgi:hypothetical protein